MKHIFTYILFFLLVQTSWATRFVGTYSTSKPMTVTFQTPSKVFVSETNFSVGAFVVRADTLFCVGVKGVIGSIPSPFSMTVYGNDSINDGALPNEEIIFIGGSIFPTRCEIRLDPVAGGKRTPITYTENATKGVATWSERSIELKYPQSTYCGSEEEINPEWISNMPFYGVTKYTVNTNNLVLNPSTGAINPSLSLPGEYQLKLEIITGGVEVDGMFNRYCIQEDVFDLEISDQNTVTIDDYIQEITPQSCDGEEGKLILDTNGFSFNSIQIEKDFDTENYVIDSDEIPLSAGDYLIKSVIDSNDCQYSADYSFTIPIDGNCEEEFLLMPSVNNAPTQILFEEKGELKVLDKSGTVIKTLSVPTTWNGQGDNGKEIDAGIYFIYLNDKFLKNLHVYR
ncbi:MAG: hypothetical protein GY827_11830 [Cytophagales bacterium]|nr:hypothetical protein [Cytophagales bacterium]